MNPLLIYLLLVKATLTSFSGMASLPIVRDDFVTRRHVLTDHQLSTAVAVGRAVPGPNGLYMVSVGYFVAGWPGAVAGCFALMTPPFLVIPLIRRIGRNTENPRLRGAIRAITLAAGGLLLAAVIPLARETITTLLAALIGLASFCVLFFTEVDTLWVILASAVLGLAGILLA